MYGTWLRTDKKTDFNCTKSFGSGGIRTHAIEMTGALNQRLRPLGHATTYPPLEHNAKII